MRRKRKTVLSVLSLVLVIILCAAPSAFGARFSFVVMADSRGETNGVNDDVLSRIADLVVTENAAFVLFPGDLVDGSPADPHLALQLNHWRDVMSPIYASDMHGAKVYAGVGNHEVRSTRSEAVWQSIFNDLPDNGPPGETYMTYSFDYMDSHFVMLSTNRAGNPHTVNLAWLANDLASTSAKRIFVFGHEPAYPVGPHIGSSLDVYPAQRDAFWKLLAAHKVNAYFAGHEHLYNRNIHNGVHHIITGGSGAPIHPGYGGEFHHYALVTVNEDDVFVEIVDDTGLLRDSFRLNEVKEPSPDIKGNGLDEPMTITQGELLAVTVALDPGSHNGMAADWWVAAETPFGLYWYTVDKGWVRSDKPIAIYGGPLFKLASVEVLNTTSLPVGAYTFYFGVDLPRDGLLAAGQDQFYFDTVEARVTP